MDGAELIAQERRRQIEQEGWTLEHDDGHVEGELSLAAACYAIYGLRYGTRVSPHKSIWPVGWDWKWFKPKSRIKNLVRAGALIAAEIDRLKRIV